LVIILAGGYPWSVAINGSRRLLLKNSGRKYFAAVGFFAKFFFTWLFKNRVRQEQTVKGFLKKAVSIDFKK